MPLRCATSVCPSALLSACENSRNATQVFVKFYIREIFKLFPQIQILAKLGK
jgi:hypothetical protein